RACFQGARLDFHCRSEGAYAMSGGFDELLEKLRGAQAKSIQRQQNVTSAVNQAVAGGLSGLAGVADALDQLRQKPVPDNYPLVGNPGALNQALASLAQAQVDATNRNAHVANAVNAAVVAGTDGMAEVAAGLRRLAQDPAAPIAPAYTQAVDQQKRL